MGENILLRNTASAEKKRLAPYLEVVPVVLQQELARTDEPIEFVWFPHDCVTSTLVTSEEGPSLEVGLMGAEGMVGLSLLFDERISNTTVIGQVPGQASRMAAKDFRREVVEQRGALFQLLQRYCNAFMAMIAQSAACNSLHPIEERMCRWILMTHDRVKRDVPLTHKFLAMMLGVRRPTLSTTANALKQAGLIDYTRGSITVLNRRALEDSSCECYTFINRQFDRIFNHDWRQIKTNR